MCICICESFGPRVAYMECVLSMTDLCLCQCLKIYVRTFGAKTNHTITHSSAYVHVPHCKHIHTYTHTYIHTYRRYSPLVRIHSRANTRTRSVSPGPRERNEAGLLRMSADWTDGPMMTRERHYSKNTYVGSNFCMYVGSIWCMYVAFLVYVAYV